MKRKQPSLGPLEAKFFSYIQMKEYDTISVGQLQEPLKLTAQQEKRLLCRLAKKNLIVRLKRGIYLTPKRLPAGGHWQPNEYYIVAQYMKFCSADFYIGGINALYHHQLIHQIPNSMTVYNTKVSGKRQVGVLRINFIKVPKEKIGSRIPLNIPDSPLKSYISSFSKTLVDILNEGSRYHMNDRVYKWLKNIFDEPDKLKEFINIAVKYGKIGTIKRIGFVIDYYLDNPQVTNKLLKHYKPTKGLTLLEPLGSNKGKINEKWRIIENIRLD